MFDINKTKFILVRYFNEMKNSQNSDNSFVFDLFEDMQQNNLNYIYRGVFTQSITDNILLLTEACMNNAGEDSKIKKRVFTILVEGLQNVTRHQEIEGDDVSANQSGIFIIQNHGDKYYITTGNPILKSNIPKLIRQLEKINGLDPDQLKIFYKEVLNDNIISNKGGAGLGLIEMARKSGNKLDFDFSDINDRYSYFYMGTTVLLSDAAKPSLAQHSMEAIKAIHKTINDQNIALIFNGIHTQESLLHIISIMEEHFSNVDIKIRKKLIYVIIEMLQNTVKHGYKHDGRSTKAVFFISHDNSTYKFNSVNYIQNEKVEAVLNKIVQVNSMSEKELNELYEKNLSESLSDTREVKGLGLTEIRLRTQNKIECITSKYDDKLSAIFMQATI